MGVNSKDTINEIKMIKSKINKLEKKIDELIETKNSNSCMGKNISTNLFETIYNKIKSQIIFLKDKINSFTKNENDDDNTKIVKDDVIKL